MFATCRSLTKATLIEPKVSLSYTGCRLGATEIAAVYADLYDFREIMTIDVSPVTDWAADDVITGQSSGATCTVVSKIDATNYIVKTRVATAYTLGEVIGVTGNANKLADQGAANPTFAPIEHLALDVAPATTWAVGDIVLGRTSLKKCTIVEKFSGLLYSVKNRTGALSLDEILTSRETMTLNVAPSPANWAAGDVVSGAGGASCTIVSVTSTTVYIVTGRVGTFTAADTLTVPTKSTAIQTGAFPTIANIVTNSADQGTANPIFYGRGAIAGVTAPTIVMTGNWGVGGSTTVAVNKGWTVTV
jgi:hypothetical protein